MQTSGVLDMRFLPRGFIRPARALYEVPQIPPISRTRKKCISEPDSGTLSDLVGALASNGDTDEYTRPGIHRPAGSSDGLGTDGQSAESALCHHSCGKLGLAV